MELEKWLTELKSSINRNDQKDFRQVIWNVSIEENARGKYLKLYTKVNGFEILVEEYCAKQQFVNVSYEQQSLYGFGVYELAVAQFLGIIRADPSYWNKKIVPHILIQSLESLDYSHLDMFTLEEAGWEDLLDRDRCEKHKESGLMTKVVLIDGTTAVLNNDGWVINQDQ